VVDVVEKAADIKFKHKVVLPAPLARYPYGIYGRFIRPIPIGIRQEDRLDFSFHNLLDHHLRHTIGHSWYAQKPLSARLFRNGNSAHRWRKVAARAHPIPDLIKIPHKIFVERLERLPIHPGRARIGFDRFVGVVH
jgi:hypothetical protein